MRSLLRWKMKMQVVRNNMLPDTDQLAFVDEAEKKGELAELEEQQNVKMPQVDMSFDNLVKTIIRWTRLHI